jgi:hypothetical protein
MHEAAGPAPASPSTPRWVPREQYRHEQRLKAGRPVDARFRPQDDDLPSLLDILGGLAFMAALAACLWLLPFVAAALRGTP